MRKNARKIGVVLGILGVVGCSLAGSTEVEATSGGVAGSGALSSVDSEALSSASLTLADSMVTSGLTTFGITLKEGSVDTSTGCNKSVFGMRPWYYGLAVKSGSTCIVGTPASESDITTFVWIVILNIVSDVMIAVGYLVLGFVIYGGYLYLLSGGDPGKVAKGKKTLTGALVGLAIVLLASVIVNFIIGIIS